MHFDVALLLCVLALGAFVVPMVSPRLGIPEAVGQIFFGILVGKLGVSHVLHGGHGTEEVLHA